MRKYLIALSGFLAGIMVYYHHAPVRETASVEDGFHQQEFVSTSLAAPIPSKESVIPVAIDAIDPSKEETEIIPGLPRGMKLAPKVRAVPEDQYTQGEVLMRKNGFVFIRSEGKAANVVYDQRLNTFHPLTATIKLTDVSEAMREEILREWEEYHYNKDLGILYVQSSHEKLLEDFQALKSAGTNPEYEIIQAVYQPR